MLTSLSRAADGVGTPLSDLPHLLIQTIPELLKDLRRSARLLTMS